MTMQYDVKAAYVAANGVAVAQPTRIKGYSLAPGATAGDIVFYDNASAASGSTPLTIPITNNVINVAMTLPGEGIKFNNGVYITVPASTKLTVYYG